MAHTRGFTTDEVEVDCALPKGMGGYQGSELSVIK